MKTTKTYHILAIFTACSTLIIGENSAQTLTEPTTDSVTNYFLVQQTSGQENSISLFTSPVAVKVFMEQTYSTKVNYIEHLYKKDVSPVAQLITKNANGKNYIHCLVKNDVKNGIFILERSDNGVNFCAVGFKNRIGSPIDQLCYYFTDEAPAGENYYRILAMGEDGSYSYSDIVKIVSAAKVTGSPLYY